MEAVRKKVFTIWRSIDELKAKRNVVVLYREGERTLKEIEYHNREIDKGRGDNPLFIVFHGQLDGSDFFLAPAPLDAAKDAKVPIWSPVFMSNVVDNCEALAYWLLRYPICGYAITEQAARIIGKCAQVLKEAGSKYQIECPPPSPVEVADAEVKVYAPVKFAVIGNTPFGKMAVLPVEGETIDVKYTYPFEVIYSVLRENPDTRLRVEGASELALRLQICKEFKLCVAPVEVLSEGRPLAFEIRDRAVQLIVPRVYVTDKLEYVPSVNAPIKQVELVPVGSIEEAPIRAHNEYGVMPSPEVHKQLCIAYKKLGIFYAFHKFCNIMTRQEILQAARNMAGGAEPMVITIHPSVEGLPRGLIGRDKGIYVVLEAENPDFYYVPSEVALVDVCTALKMYNIEYPPNHKILGELCGRPQQPRQAEPQPVESKEWDITEPEMEPKKLDIAEPEIPPSPPPQITQPSPPPQMPPPQQPPPPPPTPQFDDRLDAVREMAEELAKTLGAEIKGDPVEWLMYYWDEVMEAVRFRLKYRQVIDDLDEILEFYRKYKPVIDAVDEKCLRKCLS